jgi:hypothetical protein
LQGEKKELFKMIEEIKGKQSDYVKIYKDKIIELENEIANLHERAGQMEVELNY